jgi:glutamate/aspartate transport system substrate-binding protein
VRIDHQQHGAAKEVGFAINHFYTGTRLLVKKLRHQAMQISKGKTAITTGTTNLQVLRKANAEQGWGIVVMRQGYADGFLLVENDRRRLFGMDDILLTA